MADSGKNFGRYLRSNMTTPEVLVWTRLQKEQTGYAISRQFRIGPYFVDFYCRKYRVAFEIDGKVHELKKHADESRDLFLMNKGLNIYRFSAKEVLRDPDSIAERIREILDRHSNPNDN